jgi:hypothetical protein
VGTAPGLWNDSDFSFSCDQTTPVEKGSATPPDLCHTLSISMRIAFAEWQSRRLNLPNRFGLNMGLKSKDFLKKITGSQKIVYSSLSEVRFVGKMFSFFSSI